MWRIGMNDEIQRLHKVQLELLEEMKRICDKHNLTFYLFYGSLLGAVRHQGFIPWDDDVDIAMPRFDFEKLIEISKKEVEYPYYLQTFHNGPELITNGKAMLRRSDTTGVLWGRDVLKNGNQGIFIDIFPLDKIPNNCEIKDKIWKKLDWYLALCFIKANASEVKQIKKIGIGKRKFPIYKFIAQFLSYEYINTKMKIYMTRGAYETEDYSITCFSNELGSYRHKLYEREWFDQARMVPFETLVLPIPNKAHDLLKDFYGSNYMEIPPENKRKTVHSKIRSMDVPYDIYLRHFLDIYKDAAEKKIIVFGAGHMTEHYLQNEGKKYRPIFLVDNDKRKWGSKLNGIEIKAPAELKKMDFEHSQVIICSIYYKEIEQQLIEMGIENYYFYIQNKNWL